MYFINETTEATTKKDRDYLIHTCVLLKTLCFIGDRKRKEISNWKMLQIECHSIARLVHLFMKELTLVDGFLIGLQINPDKKIAEIVHTDHSWLVTPDGSIIDPYPMGLLSTTSALLIPTKNTRYVIHGSNFYHKNPKVHENFDVANCWKKARSLLRILKKNCRKDDISKIFRELI